MNRFLCLLRTSQKLGLKNCIYVFLHRVALRIKIYRLNPIRKIYPLPEIFEIKIKRKLMSSNWSEIAKSNCLKSADELLLGKIRFYGFRSYNVGAPPKWFVEPFSSQSYQSRNNHWSELKHFEGYDIKHYWELSRWAWAPLLARAFIYSGDNKYLLILKEWIENWCTENPVNQGCNWLCAQEASIRLIHALQCWKILDTPHNVPSLSEGRKAFVISHLKRISITQLYAKSQSNNHWISEAAALFIGGSWLGEKHYAELGRKSLEQSVKNLIMKDGSFSQHSINYHRLVIDTLVQVEIWRKLLDLPRFSEHYQQSFYNAFIWLVNFIDPITGDAPNLGGNDGAYCYALHNLPFRDFRPSLQLASKVLRGKTLFKEGLWNEPLEWFKLDKESSKSLDIKLPTIRVFNDGGYVILRPKLKSWALLRIPIYKFRPSQSDPLHLDLWHRGKNILKDAGTYSYNCNFEQFKYFSGIESHNTVQFDDYEPMPRLSRFLWGDWLNLNEPIETFTRKDSLSATASYSCEKGYHKRSVNVNSSGLEWRVIDQIKGYKKKAIIRWRLCNSDWTIDGYILRSALAEIEINNSPFINNIELVNGWESEFYNFKSRIKVLIVEVTDKSAHIETKIKLF